VLEALARFPNAKAVAVIGSGINEIDLSGEEKIRALAEQLQQSGVDLYMSSMKKQVVDMFERAHPRIIPPERIFKTKAQA
jgi:sulfate permease, SulP family